MRGRWSGANHGRGIVEATSSSSWAAGQVWQVWLCPYKRTSCPFQLPQRHASPDAASSRPLVAPSHTELLASCLVGASLTCLRDRT